MRKTSLLLMIIPFVLFSKKAILAILLVAFLFYPESVVYAQQCSLSKPLIKEFFGVDVHYKTDDPLTLVFSSKSSLGHNPSRIWTIDGVVGNGSSFTNPSYSYYYLDPGTHTFTVKINCPCGSWINSDLFEINVAAKPERITKPTLFLKNQTVEAGKLACILIDNYQIESPITLHQEKNDLRYNFIWGNGSVTTGGDRIECHEWAIADTYEVRGQVHCKRHDFKSPWSDSLVINVVDTPEEQITKPNPPSGPVRGKVETCYTYSAGGSKSTKGHSVLYNLTGGSICGSGENWADIQFHSPGWYTIQAQARCSTHGQIKSRYSSIEVRIEEEPPLWETIRLPQGISRDWVLEWLGFWLAISMGWTPPSLEDSMLKTTNPSNETTDASSILNQTPAWAVGHDNENKEGVLLRYKNETWKAIPLPYVSSNWKLTGLDFLSETEGWAVGKDIANKKGVMLHYKNEFWSVETPPSVSSDWELKAIQFTSSTEGWAVGYDNINKRGVLLRYSNGSWSIGNLPYVSANWEIRSLHFISSSEGWAVGYDIAGAKGIILRYQNNTWSLITPPNVSANWDLSGIHFTSSNEGWAVGTDYVNRRGVLIHFLNGNWTSVNPPSVSSDWSLKSVHFRHPEEGWAVGYDATNKRGVMLWYSGDSWDLNTPPEVSSDWELTGIRLSEKGEAWAVGNDKQNKQGVLLRMVPPPEAVLPPDPPVGPETGTIGTSYTYIAAGARSTYDHPLEYQVDWKGDGTDLSSWGSQELSRVFNSSGTYNIKTRARCAWDTTIESDWSEPLSVTIISNSCPAPGTPSNPIPQDSANNVSITPTLSWSACSDTDSYDVYLGTSSPPSFVANTASTSYVPSALSGNTLYYWKIVAKNNCGNSTSGPTWSFTTTSSPGTQPIPDIKANGSDGPISVSQQNPLSIVINLNSGDHFGQNADWWILVSTSAGPYSYHVGNSWTPGVSTVYQGPLMDLAYAELFNMSGLPTGTYTFYFGVDLNMNGSLDMDKLYYDSVNVTITQ